VEISAGAVLVRLAGDKLEALVIRMRDNVYELPKGHVEPGESHAQAALRELREETGAGCPVDLPQELGSVQYPLRRRKVPSLKTVHYFLATPVPLNAPVWFNRRPRHTRERRWVTELEVCSLPLVSPDLFQIICRAFRAARQHAGLEPEDDGAASGA
jgi:8-oxo-dGTP pyrophosphatase MutT (NUDIX family)